MATGRSMGLGALGNENTCFKMKYRWLMTIDDVAGDSAETSVDVLPPQKSARPNISFKEIQVEHLTETIYYPGKPEYKPIQITLYDIKTRTLNPIMKWIDQCYKASTGKWSLAGEGLMRDIRLQLFDGCGNVLERWVYENAWPQLIDFGELDMGASEVVTADITLRYARSYIEENLV